MNVIRIINKKEGQHRKNGFTLVETVTSVLIITVLASATFLGGATVIKQSRRTKAINDLRNYSSYLEDMFYNNPSYASKGVASEEVSNKMNEYLTTDLQVYGTGSRGNSKTLKDAWDDTYNFVYDKTVGKTEAAILVWSSGANQKSESSLSGVTPTIGGDDIAILVKIVDGEVSTTIQGAQNSENGEIEEETQTVAYTPGLYESGHAGDDAHLLKSWETLKTEYPDAIGNNAIDGCSNERKSYFNELSGDLVIPSNIASIGQYTFYNCTNLTLVILPNGIKSIESNAFSCCTNLGSIVIPSSVTTISDFAFYNCCRLKSVTIPSKVASIGDNAFGYCECLTSIIIQNGAKSIGERAFDSCTGLSSITIPGSVTSIGNSAFNNCTGLSLITINSGVKSIGDAAFFGCTGLTSIIIPGSVLSIGDNAFSGCTDLESVIVQNGVQTIGEWAFNECTSLKSITIPDSITQMANAFNNSGLTSAVIQDGAVSICNKAFANCENLISVILPNSIKLIDAEAFEHCHSLQSVTIPSEVKTISEYAFSQCYDLALITFGGTKDQWKAITKGTDWSSSIQAIEVVCTDGNVSI